MFTDLNETPGYYFSSWAQGIRGRLSFSFTYQLRRPVPPALRFKVNHAFALASSKSQSEILFYRGHILTAIWLLLIVLNPLSNIPPGLPRNYLKLPTGQPITRSWVVPGGVTLNYTLKLKSHF